MRWRRRTAEDGPDAKSWRRARPFRVLAPMARSAAIPARHRRRLLDVARSLPVKLAVAAALLAVAVWALRLDFKGVSIADVVTSFETTPPWAVLIAAAALAASFLCLGATEWSALKYLGKTIAPPRAFGVAFVCYAFSNSIGFGPATVSAVR